VAEPNEADQWFRMKQMGRKKPSPPARFQQKLFAFVDILGFGDLVGITQNDPIQLNRLKETLELVTDYARKPSRLKGVTSWWSMAFSDSIVISEENSLRGFLNVLENLALLSWRMLSLGKLVRGAITLGPIYHRHSVVFGPALIEAYFLEREAAVYPRIIIADKLLNAMDSMGDGFKAEVSEADPDLRATCRLLLRRDKDGFYFVDTLNAGIQGIRILFKPNVGVSINADHDGGRANLIKTRAWIEKDLSGKAKSNRESDLKVAQKLSWFRDYIDTVLAEDSGTSA
jgi:hypothetical protein